MHHIDSERREGTNFENLNGARSAGSNKTNLHDDHSAQIPLVMDNNLGLDEGDFVGGWAFPVVAAMQKYFLHRYESVFVVSMPNLTYLLDPVTVRHLFQTDGLGITK